MIKAVLFDLDDTLVSLNLTAFLARYMADLSHLLAKAARMPLPRVGLAMGQALLDIDRQDRSDDLTNGELFAQSFFARTGIPLGDSAILDMIACYEHEVLPDYKDGIVRARPIEGNRRVVDAVWSQELVCALATNPTFNLDCDLVRMEWAGLYKEDFALISTLANSRRTKPCARYYQEFANQLGVRLEDCLMVGNDASRDFPRPDCGLRTAYVGHGWPKRAVWRGSLDELSRALPDLVARLNDEGC